mgnify:CR=1 FL=1
MTNDESKQSGDRLGNYYAELLLKPVNQMTAWEYLHYKTLMGIETTIKYPDQARRPCIMMNYQLFTLH